MSTISVIENKISSVRKYLTILGDFKKRSQEEIFSDPVITGAFERYLYLVVQATIEVGESYIAYRNYRKPTTMRDVFSVLCENKDIDSNLMERLSKMTGFRNALAHDYEELDPEILYRALHEDLADIDIFVSVMEKQLEAK